MDLVNDRYRLIEYRVSGSVSKFLPESIWEVLERLWSRLNSIRATEAFDRGVFVPTTNPMTNETLIKRYRVDVSIPSTTFIVKRLDAGSIDTDLFMEIIENVKRK